MILPQSYKEIHNWQWDWALFGSVMLISIRWLLSGGTLLDMNNNEGVPLLMSFDSYDTANWIPRIFVYTSLRCL